LFGRELVDRLSKSARKVRTVSILPPTADFPAIASST
jgi:nucleotidyltransferase/DNA polymerase involved in DNA repair